MGIGGENISFQCNFCHQVYRGSYSRVKCHLLKTKGGMIASCSRVTSAIWLELNQVVEEAELRVKQSLPRQVPLPFTMASGSSSKTCSTEERRKIYGEFANFSRAIEDFASADSVEDRGFMSPMKCTYNFIHSMRRNKMTPQRAKDLVYVYTNLRLLSRRSPTYNEGPSQQWDVGGDSFDSMNMENSGIIEIADLSLDESDLEDVLFSSIASNSVIVDE
ncbi:hypothetical protein JRO89_XS12G0229700 [Xanthoceras sorbifolium]|uniref:BED-type domain-containing protein n=1 Tax=Xanthoceras sorbifolium TaxID=99658 RepID=A0ABQ8HDE8_9ROSI|nr:hypothetical protein JRO89_XS12G0229700 [Xanthoceras sorbifolium]